MFQCGYVAIVGAPNVGKSTLLNHLLGEKLSIVTDKPQTTRHRILGIYNQPKAQILFLDTPGIHPSNQLLNVSMVQAALGTLHEADVVVHMVFPRALSAQDQEIARRVHELGKSYLVVINKVDQVQKESLLPLIEKIHQELNPLEIIPLSALQKDGLSRFIESILKHLPEGHSLYPVDEYTERDARFLCAEIVREKAMQLLHQEIPYALATITENYQEGPKLDRIAVGIIVEKKSQKPIVIGAKGTMLKKIGEMARKEMEGMLGKKVFLELFVKVEDNWTKDQRKLKEFGLSG